MSAIGHIPHQAKGIAMLPKSWPSRIADPLALAFRRLLTARLRAARNRQPDDLATLERHDERLLDDIGLRRIASPGGFVIASEVGPTILVVGRLSALQAIQDIVPDGTDRRYARHPAVR